MLSVSLDVFDLQLKIQKLFIQFQIFALQFRQHFLTLIIFLPNLVNILLHLVLFFLQFRLSFISRGDLFLGLLLHTVQVDLHQVVQILYVDPGLFNFLSVLL